MLKLLFLLLSLSIAAIGEVVLFSFYQRPDYEIPKTPLYYTLDMTFAFIFWFCVYICTWLVAFKYHEQSRQLLRIDRLTS